MISAKPRRCCSETQEGPREPSGRRGESPLRPATPRTATKAGEYLIKLMSPRKQSGAARVSQNMEGGRHLQEEALK